jgi:hypothetical protein
LMTLCAYRQQRQGKGYLREDLQWRMRKNRL